MDSIDRNWGHTTRLGSVNNSKSVDLCGPLWLDLFTQSKYLLNLLDVHIKLVRAKPDFCLFGGEGRLFFDDAILYVRRDMSAKQSFLVITHIACRNCISGHFSMLNWIDGVPCKQLLVMFQNNTRLNLDSMDIEYSIINN